MINKQHIQWIAILLIAALVIGAFIVPDDPEPDAGVSEFKIEIKPLDGDAEASTLTMDVPERISLTQQILSDLGIVPLSSTSETLMLPSGGTGDDTTETDYLADTELQLRGSVNVWWSGENLQSVDKVNVKEYGSTGQGLTLWNYEQTSKYLERTVTGDLETTLTESTARTYTPANYFTRTRSIDYSGATDTIDTIIAEELDDGTLKAEVTVTATDEAGETLTETTTVESSINVDYDAAAGTLTLNAELTNVDVEANN